MVTLENVIDTRTGQFHSVAIVKERNVKYFVPADEEPEPIIELTDEEEAEEEAEIVQEADTGAEDDSDR